MDGFDAGADAPGGMADGALIASPWMTEEHLMLSETARRFFADRWVDKAPAWRKSGVADRDMWREAAAEGLLLPSIPEEYGGVGADFGFETVICIEHCRANLMSWGFAIHSPIVAHYILAYGSEEQKKRWLPKLASGELLGALAMTEPSTGSDLKAIRTTARKDGNAYRLSGQKTFITNGAQAELIIVAAKTDKDAGSKGVSLLVVETDAAEGRPVAGFTRGRNLEKPGLKWSGASELFFDDVMVPRENLLGRDEGEGFYQLMQQLGQERLAVAAMSIGAMERGLAETIAYTKERKAFGGSVFDFQNTKFTLAEQKATAIAARTFFDHCMAEQLAGRLTPDLAAMAKFWITDRAQELLDACLQLHGGYGYMLEYPICELWADHRVQRIYAGSNEIMRELTARAM